MYNNIIDAIFNNIISHKNENEINYLLLLDSCFGKSGAVKRFIKNKYSQSIYQYYERMKGGRNARMVVAI